MGDGVDDRFADHPRRDLVGGGRLVGGGAGADGEVEAGEHEIHGLIHQLEHRALEHLIRGNRLGHGRAVEVGRLEFAAEQEALGLAAEQPHGGMHGLAVIKQVEMGEQLGRGSVGRQGKPRTWRARAMNLAMRSASRSAREALGQGKRRRGRYGSGRACADHGCCLQRP